MVNKVILVGNVGQDPEVKHLESNVSVANFSLATSESYKNKSGERVTNTEWHNIVVWRGTADFVEKYVKKGAKLYVEGRIRTRSYDDKDGNKRYITEIYGDNLQMLDRKPEGNSDFQGTQSASTTQPAKTEAKAEPEAPVDDLPF